MLKCLNNEIEKKIFSTSINKNDIMKRLKSIEKNLLNDLFFNAKLFLILNCWSTKNRQSYMSFIMFFIDRNWNFFEMLLSFECIRKKHNEKNLIDIVWLIVFFHRVQHKLMIITTNNASNNDTLFFDLMNNFQNRNSNSIMNVDFEHENFENIDTKSIHLFCLIHVIQLTLQILLNSIKIKSINEKFQKIWSKQNEREKIQNNMNIKNLFLTLIKTWCLLY